MKNINATAIIFLIFSSIVAFANININNYQYILFVIPFLIAILLKNKVISLCFTLFGIISTSIYVMLMQNIYVGILGMVISSCIFFSSGFSIFKIKVYLYVASLLVFNSSYFGVLYTNSRIVHALLDTGLFAVSSICIYISFKEHIKNYIDIMKDAQNIAHDAINTIKKD